MTEPTFESETQISAYPEGGIDDVRAWRVEVGLLAYSKEQLSLKQLAAFIGMSEEETLEIMANFGVEYIRDADWLEQEMEGVEYSLQIFRANRSAEEVAT